MAETICDEWRKARKPHRCIWCGEPIAIGETYRHWRGKWEGEVMSNDWHKECDDAADSEDLEEGFEPHSYKRGTQEERQQVPKCRHCHGNGFEPHLQDDGRLVDGPACEYCEGSGLAKKG